VETRLLDLENFEMWLEIQKSLNDYNKSFKKAREKKELDEWLACINRRRKCTCERF
jgi:hypothetical protein